MTEKHRGDLLDRWKQNMRRTIEELAVGTTTPTETILATAYGQCWEYEVAYLAALKAATPDGEAYSFDELSAMLRQTMDFRDEVWLVRSPSKPAT